MRLFPFHGVTNLTGWRRALGNIALALCFIPVVVVAGGVLSLIVVLGYALSMICFIFRTKKQRLQDRLRCNYRKEGRVIDWRDAYARITAGQGLFLASDGPSGVGNIWWSEADLNRLDPGNNLRNWKTFGCGKCLDCAARRQLEVHMQKACRVRRLPRSRFAMAHDLRHLPCMQIDFRLDEVGLTGQVSDPMSWPTGDPVSDSLRTRRDQLLDQYNLAISKEAHFEAAQAFLSQIKALEKQLQGKLTAP
jgi:hypothetical protein